MKTRYKIILSGKSIYKEIELSPELKELRIGTSHECSVRLRRELFFSPIELILKKSSDGWQLLCSDNLYLTVGDVRKLMTKKLIHGDEFLIKYQDSDNDVLSVSFMIDFEYAKRDYNIEIDISGNSEIKIGGNNCQIKYVDQYLQNDSMSLIINEKTISVQDNQSKYGVFVNGVKIKNTAVIHDYDFFSIVGFSFFYKSGKIYTSDEKNLLVSGLKFRKINQHSTNFEYPKFNRNTRIRYVIPNDVVEVQQPIQKPTKPKQNLLMTLAPSIAMLILTIVLRGIVSNAGTFVIYSAISMGIGIIMSIVTYFTDKKNYENECQNRIDTYNNYIAQKEKEIQESRENELRVRNLIYQSLENNIAEVDRFGKRLFERSEKDNDYLHVYLGRGRIPSASQVNFSKQEFVDPEDPLMQMPEEIAEKYRYIDDAPIVSDMNTSCGVGIVSTKEMLMELIKNITLDISIRHFYNDVKMVFILGDDFVSKMGWIRWLHNVENTRLDVKNIVCDEESRNIILEDLYITLSSRENLISSKSEEQFDCSYIVFVTDAEAISKHPVSKYIQNCADYGFTFVFFEEQEEMLPRGCTEIIRVNNSDNGYILKSENGDKVLNFQYPTVSDAIAEKIALKLGAVSVDEVTLESELTKNITVFEMLGILSVDDIDLNNRWASATVYKTLAAPIGVKSKNQLVYLDISDKSGAHGPHGLVAGTTGSGKSEVLQTYILSMCTAFHPYEVGFVIIDFKGGGMANQFKKLPHLIGTITNIDGREINRSLLSIKAELVKRQELFSENGVNHINDYIKLYKSGKVSTPLPHLIMIVDEFAELKQEFPDFMKELISAARIGRTLGVHLILATQKPAGVIDAQIWSNSKFKLCLKVQTKEDSNEVIKTPLAAEIVEPGRAYFQVGNNEIFDLFQSAYSGADIPDGNENNEKIFSIYERNLWGKKTLKYTNKKQKSSKESVSQLSAIVDYVYNYCEQIGIEKLPGICLPSLKDKILTDEIEYMKLTSKDIIVPIGFYDDPEQQDQGVFDLNISKDNVYIVGASQSGKTILLQTLVYGLIKMYSSEQVNIYLIDCGSMLLKIFDDSNHVGGVILSNEDDKCKNLFKLLNRMVTERKKVLASKGVGSYSAYIEAGYTDMPLSVVIIDNMAAFKEYFADQVEDIDILTREAKGVGISFIITAASSNAINYRTQANFGKKIVLNCNDINEYSNVLGHCRQYPKENPGRGLYLKDKRILEFQVALFGNSVKESERSRELREFIFERNRECTSKALNIPIIPEKLLLESEMKEKPQEFRNQGIIPIGMNFDTVAFTYINFSTAGSLCLIGSQESKDLFVKNFVRTIARNAVFQGIESYVVDDKSRKLSECEKFGFVRQYVSDSTDGVSIVSDFCNEVMERFENEEKDKPYIMLIINSIDSFRKVCADKLESKRLADVIKIADEVRAFVLISVVENQPVGFNSPEIMKVLKDERRGILFDQMSELKLYDVSGRFKTDTSFNYSTGYYLSGNTYYKIKIFE